MRNAFSTSPSKTAFLWKATVVALFASDMVLPFRVDLADIPRITSGLAGNLPLFCNPGKVDQLSQAAFAAADRGKSRNGPAPSAYVIVRDREKRIFRRLRH